MHTGQIIMLTKLLTASDLRFYDFEAGSPVERWRPEQLTGRAILPFICMTS